MKGIYGDISLDQIKITTGTFSRWQLQLRQPARRADEAAGSSVL
jgi:hypothetical protein